MSDKKESKSPRRKPTPRPVNLVYKVTDKDGNVIEDAKVVIAAITRNANEVVDLLQSDRDLVMERVEAKSA